MYNGPHIPQKDLKVYLDITNSDCYEANDIADPIVADTKLYNLADKSFTEYFYNIQNTEAYQQTVTPTQLPILCMQHDAFEGNTNRDTTWFSATSVPRVLSYSFVCWYKFDNVNQQSENIYGGGFNGRLSFYMSPSGTSANSYVLLYSSSGSANGWTAGFGNQINDNKWHMRSYTVTGPSTGVTTCKTYIDGAYYGAYTSNSSYVADTSNRSMTWGSWTQTYGNMAGQLNGYMYYERVLSDEEMRLIYLATKEKYGV
jgi:hypothetical protein|tara:strand:+ start:41 stop:811 length:771 start_codon:yes stop_codon:yes gene_type:complete